MRGITEDEVVRAWRGLAVAACESCGRSLPWEDRQQVAYEGLLYAIRTYRGSIAGFRRYAWKIMCENIQDAEREVRQAKRAESSLSLDAPLPDGGSFADVLAYSFFDETLIEVRDFMSKCRRNGIQFGSNAMQEAAREYFGLGGGVIGFA